MMLESQKPQIYESNYTYEIISDSSLPAIEKLRNLPTMDSTSANQSYKYWNPATFDDNNAHASQKTIDQFIGEMPSACKLICHDFS